MSDASFPCWFSASVKKRTVTNLLSGDRYKIDLYLSQWRSNIPAKIQSTNTALCQLSERTHNVRDQKRRRSAARAAVKRCKQAGRTLTFAACDLCLAPSAAHCLDALAQRSGACSEGACVDVAAVRELLVDAQHGRCCRGCRRAVRGLDGRSALRRSAGAARAWRGPRCRLASEAVDVAGGREHRRGRRDRCRGQPVDLGVGGPRAPSPPKSRNSAEADLSGGAARGCRGAATQVARRDDRQAARPGATGVPAPRAGDRRPLPLRCLADGHAACAPHPTPRAPRPGREALVQGAGCMVQGAERQERVSC